MVLVSAFGEGVAATVQQETLRQMLGGNHPSYPGPLQ